MLEISPAIPDEQGRVDALRQLGILNANTDQYFDLITKFTVEIFGLSGSYISLLDSDHQWIKSKVSFCAPIRTMARDQSFCDYTIRRNEVTVISDTLEDARFSNNPAVTGAPQIRFYAGAPLITPNGHAIGALCVIDTKPQKFSDVDCQRLRALADLLMSHISLGRAVGHIDSVTGMPNRNQMSEDLEELGKQYAGEHRALALIDMPDAGRGFEIIRVLGAAVYDQLVCAVGDRLKLLFEGTAQIYHLTDARFALLSRNSDTTAFFDHLNAHESALQTPLNNLKIPLNVPHFGGKVGFKLCQTSAQDAPRKAAAALNHSLIKRHRWSDYENAEDIRQQRAFHMLNDVRSGLLSGQFEVVYQPKHEITDSTCLSAEALLRWTHHQLGPISPAEFIPLIEQTALIGPVTHWVLQTAIAQVAQWHLSGNRVKVAINLSAYNFEEPDIVLRLERLCRKFDVDPAYIEIECTEGIWMESGGAIQTMQNIRRLGMSIALDDFGTGYSNFAYLQKVPATVIKVDQSLIRNVHANERDQRIVRSLISLAKELEYQVVAEGVETAESLRLVRHWGCHVAQGYHFSRPLAAQDFLAHVMRFRAERNDHV